MNKFYVTVELEVMADNVDEARTLGYDLYFYGRDEAESKSEYGNILDCTVSVDEV